MAGGRRSGRHLGRFDGEQPTGGGQRQTVVEFDGSQSAIQSPPNRNGETSR